MPATVEDFPVPRTTFEYTRAQSETVLFDKKENLLKVKFFFQVLT